MTRAWPLPALGSASIGAPAEEANPSLLWSPTAFHALVPMIRPALALLITGSFLGNVIFGSNGILRVGDYRRLKTERTAELVLLEAERDRLARRSALLDPRGVDVDMADELIRSELGLVRPDEVIIELPD